jgi:hypothetical protein
VGRFHPGPSEALHVRQSYFSKNRAQIGTRINHLRNYVVGPILGRWAFKRWRGRCLALERGLSQLARSGMPAGPINFNLSQPNLVRIFGKWQVDVAGRAAILVIPPPHTLKTASMMRVNSVSTCSGRHRSRRASRRLASSFPRSSSISPPSRISSAARLTYQSAKF